MASDSIDEHVDGRKFSYFTTSVVTTKVTQIKQTDRPLSRFEAFHTSAVLITQCEAQLPDCPTEVVSDRAVTIPINGTDCYTNVYS
jgi:hypothetical protein